MENKLNASNHLDCISSESSDSEYDSYYEFSLPEQCILPDFLNTERKWSNMIYSTYTLKLWSELVARVQNCTTISQPDKDVIMKCLAGDVIYIHGLKTFFPKYSCKQCAIKH